MIREAQYKPHTWWRFIDDIFIIWTEGEEKLEEFINYLNNAHETIKFTSKWSKERIEFLDVEVINESGKLETDVYVKPTDSHQYLHYSSCHPSGCKKSIPYAQAMRLRRICSKTCFFVKRVLDLCNYLISGSPMILNSTTARLLSPIGLNSGIITRNKLTRNP